MYDIPAIAADIRGALTNQTPVDAYRGAGKPEANYIVECAIEAAARKLGRDPADLRRQNLIRNFPHKTAMGMALDCGRFVENLDQAVARAGSKSFEARRAESKARGKLRGIGVGCFLETSRGAPNEGAEVRFGVDGKVTIAVGTESNGQGHETAWSQIVADRLGSLSEALQAIYDARDPNNATGVQLSSLALAVGVERHDATPSRVVCTLTGNGLKDTQWALQDAAAPVVVPIQNNSAASGSCRARNQRFSQR